MSSPALRTFALEQSGAEKSARLGEARWLRSVSVARADGSWKTLTGEQEETLLVILGGTFDLQAGGSTWLGRGLRASPFVGRPCGVYLPPRTGLRAQGGPGELLLCAVLRPPDAAAETDPRAALSQSPLLPLAGSGKAFNPATGRWEEEERFPSAPEAVLPRRIERIRAGDVAVERIFPFAYKALAACLDEVSLTQGQALDWPAPDAPSAQGWSPEQALYYRAEDALTVEAAGAAMSVTGEGVMLLPAGAPARLRVDRGRAYAALVRAAPK
jgi:hypothetical protein